MKLNILKLFSKAAMVFVLATIASVVAFGQTTITYGWEDGDDASKWTISDAIAKTSGQGNSGTYAGKISTNHTYVQFNEKVNVTSFSFSFKRTSNNSNYNVYIETSTDGSTWTAAETYAMNSFSNGTYSTKTKTFNGDNAYYVRFHCYNTTATRYVDDVSITYNSGSSTAAATTTSIDASGISNTDVYTGTAAGSLSASVKAGGNVVNGATVTWSGNNDAVATINTNTGAVTLVGEGNVTFTASYAGVSGTYQASSATYEMTVTNSDPSLIAFDATKEYGDSPLSKGGVSFTCDNGVLDNQSEYRLYKNSTTTFSVTKGVIKKIAFTGVSGNPASGFGTQSGWTTDGNNGTWVGSSKSVSFVASGAQVRASKIVVTVDLTGAEDPSISADNVNIEYSATGGSIAFTVANPVDGGSITASTDANWLTLGNETASPITFTCSANSETTARSATVTLTYTYDSNKTVTKNVTVTQAAAPVIYSTIPALFAAATSSEKSVNVTFNSWVVSGVSTNGRNIYVTDNDGNGFIIYYASDMSNTFHAGDIISGTNVSCNLVLYNGAAEIKNLDASDLTITSGGTVSVSNIAMANLAGVNSGALVSYSNLTCSISNNKYYLSDGTTTLQLYNQLFAFEPLSSGKVYNITGVYLQYDTTKEIMPRSAADIQEIVPIVPTVTPATTSINVVAAGGDGTLAVTYDNITNVAAEVAFYQSNGTTTATYDWITASVNNENNVVYQVVANTSSEPRSAYMKVWAYDDNLSEVYSNLITITQAGFVADYATLPFSFDGGRADIEEKAGLTQSGLESDYSSSPKLKFDSADDCVILKINEAPGVLTFDIKGNPSSGSWSGTFKVQGSPDGVTYTDIKTYSSISSSKQKETIDQLESNVRYIKWILATRDNGNVALGNIVLTDSTPSIIVSPKSINAPLTGIAEGTLNVTYLNIDTSLGAAIQWYESDGTTTTTKPDWITTNWSTSKNVIYDITANHGAARNAYFKVYGRANGSSNNVYSELVTVSQAAIEVASLPFEFTGGKTDIESKTGLTHSGLGSDYSDVDTKLKFDTTDDYLVLAINEAPGTLSFKIKGNGFSGGTFKVQTSVDGNNYTDLKVYTELGVAQTETFDNLSYNVRFIKWIYTNKVNGNVGVGAISLTKPSTDSFTLSAEENGGRYWATFFNSEATYTLPAGAQAYTINGSKQLYLLGNGNVIPKNMAVIIIADASSITLTKAADTTVSISGGDNILQGSNSAIAVSSITTGTPYVLGIVGDELGFYKYIGANLPAYKAYYVVNE